MKKPSISLMTATSAGPAEIPGFYYDTEKKKYFKETKESKEARSSHKELIASKEESSKLKTNRYDAGKVITVRVTESDLLSCSSFTKNLLS